MKVLHHLSSCEVLITRAVLNTAVVTHAILYSIAIQNSTPWLLWPAHLDLGAVAPVSEDKVYPAPIQKAICYRMQATAGGPTIAYMCFPGLMH